MKSVQFIYQDTEIHFLVNPDQENVMVNATEMAKVFGKRTQDYLANQTTKEFISALEQDLNGTRSEMKIVDNRGHMGIYFDRRLALKFAAWLDSDFELWVYKTIDQILFDSHIEFRRAEKQKLETQMKLQQKTDELINQYPELKDFFELKKSDMKEFLPEFKSSADVIPFLYKSINRHIEKADELRRTIELLLRMLVVKKL